MESDKGHTFFLKNIFLLLTILVVLTAAISWLSPNGISINGVERRFEIAEYGLLLSLVCIFLPIHILTTNYIVRVKLVDHTISILTESEQIDRTWAEVKSVSKIPFVIPPLYKLKLKDNKRTFLFATKRVFLDFNFGSVDLSEMGELIAQRKKEYRL